MLTAAVILLAIGSTTTVGAIALEVKYKEPMWAILMKVACLTVALGGLLFGLA